MSEQASSGAPADGDANTNAAPAATKSSAALPGVPSSWPGAFGAYKHSKQAVLKNIWTLVIIWVLVAVVSGVLQMALSTPGRLIAYLVDALGTAAFTLTFIAGVRGQELSIGDALTKGVNVWLKIIGLNILVGLSLIVSLLLLIVPFFFVLPRLSLANYFLVDQNLGVMDAYKASWAATDGNAGKVWGIIGANIAMALLAITIIGIPFAIYFLIMYSAATAVLYEFLNKKQPAKAAAPAPATAAPAAS